MTISLTVESSLLTSIDMHLKSDTLDSSDQYKCEKCLKESKARISTELSKLPPILSFHLKRFTYPDLKKVRSLCKYPREIDMS